MECSAPRRPRHGPDLREAPAADAVPWPPSGRRAVSESDPVPPSGEDDGGRQRRPSGSAALHTITSPRKGDSPSLAQPRGARSPGRGGPAGPGCPRLRPCRSRRCGLGPSRSPPSTCPDRGVTFSRDRALGPGAHVCPGLPGGTQRALTAAGPALSADSRLSRHKLGDAEKRLHHTFGPVVLNWHKFCWALRGGNNKTDQGLATGPRRPGTRVRRVHGAWPHGHCLGAQAHG